MTNNVIIVDATMNYEKDENVMPYEEFGDLLFSGELTTIRVNYDNGYTIVSDKNGQLWKVTAEIFDDHSYMAVLKKVD